MSGEHDVFVVPSPIDDCLLVMCGTCGEAAYIDMDDLPYLPESRFISGIDAAGLAWLTDEHRRLDADLISDTPISSGLSDSAVAHPPRRVDGAPSAAGAPSKNEQEQP